MAETQTPQLPVAPKFRITRNITVDGIIIGDNVIALQPQRTFRVGEIITGTCRNAPEGKEYMGFVELVDETNVKYLIRYDAVEPVISSDACVVNTQTPAPPVGVSFCLEANCIFWYVLVILAIIILITALKSIR